MVENSDPVGPVPTRDARSVDDVGGLGASDPPGGDPAPPAAVAATAGAVRTRCLDVVVLTDLRFPGGTTSSLTEELAAAADGGYEVGVLHVANPRLGPTAAVGHRLRRFLDDGPAHLLLPGEPVRARLAVVKHPMVFSEPVGGRLGVDVDRVVVTVGQVPADDDRTHYDPRSVDANIVEALGRRALWIPVSAVVRSRLHGVELADTDWHEIIALPAPTKGHTDPAAPPAATGADDPARADEAAHADADETVRGDREAPADTRLVIGRHSRPDRLKWPADPDEIRAAYPTDGSVRVRVLGGADPVGDVLGAVPDEWEVLAFGAMEPAEFLAGLDAFVYFHHPDLTEAFGRTVLEALAAGVPAVVPAHFESVFGPACLYATPETALDVVRDLLADPDAHRAHVERARGIVRRRFSHRAHLDRLDALCGPPAGIDVLHSAPVPPDLAAVPPAHRRSFTTTLVAALGAGADELESLLRTLEDHRRRAPGFVPIVVITTNRPRLADTLGIETAIITGRRSHTEPAATWPEYARRRLRQLAAHHDVDNVVVADPHHPDAWIALQLHRARPAPT